MQVANRCHRRRRQLLSDPLQGSLMRKVLTATATAVASLTIGSTAHAQSITPSSVSATMAVGASITIHKTVTLAPSGANLVDLFFLADNTGSMGSVIANAQSGSAAILGGLPGGVSYNFGVGRYLG